MPDQLDRYIKNGITSGAENIRKGKAKLEKNGVLYPHMVEAINELASGNTGEPVVDNEGVDVSHTGPAHTLRAA